MRSYKEILENGFKDGLYLLAKYGLLIVLIYIGLNFVSGLIAGAQNGTQSAIYINKLIEKGYLPKVVNGEIPPKVEDEKTTNNDNPITK